MRRVFRHHGLSIVMLGLFFVTFLIGQVVAGRSEHNDDRAKHGKDQLGWGEYLRSSHFGEATAENWESEFLQMFVFVLATAFLYQKGSAESKDPDEHHEHKCGPNIRPESPWPVHRGGWVLRLYEHSLSLALFVLFLIAFIWHAKSGHHLYNEERVADGEAAVTIAEYLKSSRFWFESFQNWQSEFLAIGTMVVFSIWLREANSAESKKVETPHWENED
jgi:hypothetical protein